MCCDDALCDDFSYQEIWNPWNVRLSSPAGCYLRSSITFAD
jgi:hypothetical protein